MKTASLALRNLSRQKKRTILLGAAVAFGIMIVTAINGISADFVRNVSENFANLVAGHVFVEGQEKSSSGRENSIVRDDGPIMEAAKEAAEKSGVRPRYITKRSSFEATLLYGGRSAQLAISGVDFASETFLPDRLVFKEGGIAGMSDRQGVIISEPIAKRLGVGPGDRILVQMKTYTGQNNVGEFAVAGITYDSGLFGNMSGYANKAYVNELLNLAPDEYQSVGFYLDGLSGMDKFGAALRTALSARAQVFEKSATTEENPIRAMMENAKKETWEGVKYRVFTLNDMLAQVQQIVNILNTVSLVILLVLFLIIMVGITNTFRIIMFERIREIGTMRSMGMQRGEVRKLFLFEALFLALGGAVAGIVLAVLILSGLGLVNFGLDTPLFMVLKNGHLTYTIEPARAAANVLVVAVLTLLAAFLPARKAARLDPAVALRTAK